MAVLIDENAEVICQGIARAQEAARDVDELGHPMRTEWQW